MADDDRLARFIRDPCARPSSNSPMRSAPTRRRAAGELAPAGRRGPRPKLVCRRHAERRAVAVDGEGRPACFDPDHPDCQGCVEDIREGMVETW